MPLSLLVRVPAAVLAALIFLPGIFAQQPTAAIPLPAAITGFRDSAQEQQIEQRFLAVPDPRLAEEHLRILTAEPHIAGSPEDKKTADYVANKFRAAGLQTGIVEYKVWMNYPSEVRVQVFNGSALIGEGPRPERVQDDPFQNDPRITPGFSGSSPSGDVEAEAVYANYGRPEDFKKLQEMKVDVRGKVVIVRYGENYRGVKAYIAQQQGAAGVILYSDPIDDGYFKGDKYPQGPWRPDSGIQRGSILYMFRYPGDSTTPGVASTPGLPMSQRVPPEQAADQPKILSTPLSYADARPILENLGGPDSPRSWQGALPFTYHLGPGPARVKIHLRQDYQYRTIWDVIGKIPGNQSPEQWVVAGNHRDAWVYGAVDPNSGTAAMLETVHGLGELIKSGWRPRRTLVFASWDAEEEGLMGSTEWAEQNEKQLENAAAYFNMDVGVSGPEFGSSAVPSLKQFVRDVAKAIPSPQGPTLYEVWKDKKIKDAREQKDANVTGSPSRQPNAPGGDVPVGDLGSGSDYTAFLQHLGVPSTDISSTGPYGVYHSAFDNFNWFKKFGDPTFVYEQQMARVFGIEALRMADADVLPYDYENYGREIGAYIDSAEQKAAEKFPAHALDFSAARSAAQRLAAAGAAIAIANLKEAAASGDASQLPRLNQDLMATERALILPQGLPTRPWFRHAIYAPGEYTGYAAVVIPGVNEAIDAGDASAVQQQLVALAAAINRAAQTLQDFRPAGH
jgi:N-acetylated-alpha-linked acidic dipeptidase